jgi:toxin ParE1/3/4
MKYKLRFSACAIHDMQQVLEHTLREFGESNHEQCKALIRQALLDIAADPDRPPAKRRPELHPTARTFHIARRRKRARHFFLYRIDGKQRYVDVGRFLHDSMDLERHLPERFSPDDS